MVAREVAEGRFGLVVTGFVPLLLGDDFAVGLETVGCVCLELSEAILTVVPGVSLVAGKGKNKP